MNVDIQVPDLLKTVLVGSGLVFWFDVAVMAVRRLTRNRAAAKLKTYLTALEPAHYAVALSLHAYRKYVPLDAVIVATCDHKGVEIEIKLPDEGVVH